MFTSQLIYLIQLFNYCCLVQYHRKNFNMLKLRPLFLQTLTFNIAKKSSSSPVHMEDWEYIIKIDEQLKQGDINNALKFMINSYLSGQILDMQTYRNMHYRMNQLKANISYQQITYKLYREYFKPHPLMLEWMKMLSQTTDKKTKQLLKNDFQILNVEMPVPELGNPNQKQDQPLSQEGHQQGKKVEFEKKNTDDVDQIEKKIKQEFKNKSINLEKQILENGLEAQELKKMIEGLLQHYEKIVIHDVEFFCDFMEEGEEYQEPEHDDPDPTEQQQFEEMEDNENPQQKMEESLVDLISAINRIKIGKIQIYDKNNDNKNK